MGLYVSRAKGYLAGTRCEDTLRFVREYGNSKQRYIVFADKRGRHLHWRTTDRTKLYKNLQDKAAYRFTVENIYEHNKQINITKLTLM